VTDALNFLPTEAPMTRETKIGLLVGLAFLIVIGILLSDQLQRSAEPQQAQLAVVGPNVRESMTTVGQPVLPPAYKPAPPVSPQTPFVTRDELKQPPSVRDVIKITTPDQQPQSELVHLPPDNRVSGPVQLVNDHPGELEIVRGPQEPARTPQPTAPQFKSYVAQEGDSLSRIASRLMGSSSKANCNAIIAANPTLKDNPDRIIAGKEYLIPQNAAAVQTVATTGQPSPAAPAQTAKKTEPVDTGTYWYTVKENDSLWKIAADQLGSGNSWTAIKELNKDILKGGETLQTNMRLRLPAKPTGATASARD
jgi:nucleoid-associated protein YgaU